MAESSSNIAKFWRRSIMEDTTTDDDSSNNPKDKEESTSYEYTIDIPSSSEGDKKPQQNQLSLFNAFDQADASTKRYQTKMLLASLIEHFCRTYGDTPDANRKVFFLICQTLRSLGIIDAEFVDEMTSVRSAFQSAFHKLFFTAVQTVRNQDLVHYEDDIPRIKSEPSSDVEINFHHDDETTSSSSSPENGDYFSTRSHLSTQYSTPSISNKLSTSASSLHSFMGGDGDIFYNLSVQNSRYNNDFIEINLLGKGGFASAFRARNRLDGIYYAIKKIRLGSDIKETDSNNENPYEKIFREIKNLARLEHQNVIRYYSSWLEFTETQEALDTDDSDWEEEEEATSPGNLSDDESSIFHGRDPHFSDSEYEESGMSHIQFGEASSGQDSSSFVGSLSSNSSSRPKSKSGWTLFIQMQLCPTTLHDYIKHRNKQYAEDLSYDIVDTRRNIEIFAQILEGTAYIHDQGLIHRDLKPSNIFLSMPHASTYVNDIDGKRRRRRVSSAGPIMETAESSATSPGSEGVPFENCMWEESWVPKIGDFGLAAEVHEDSEGVLVPTPISTSPPSLSSIKAVTQVKKFNRPQPRRTRTIGVGTRTYASPEQLAIPAQAYDEKVDIYSLGIILFELFQPFATGMERADSLDKLKHGVFPTGFLELYPKVSALIIWMMDTDPRQRPSAHQLLEFELFSHPSVQDDGDICLTLKTQLQSKINLLDRKSKEIDDLKARLEQKELEKQLVVNALQTKIDELQVQLGACHCQKPVVARKGILTPTSSFARKKKEVSWK